MSTATEVLESLQAAMKRNPDLRVGQLLCLSMRNNGRSLDLFNVTDQELAALLDRLGSRLAVPDR